MGNPMLGRSCGAEVKLRELLSTAWSYASTPLSIETPRITEGVDHSPHGSYGQRTCILGWAPANSGIHLPVSRGLYINDKIV